MSPAATEHDPTSEPPVAPLRTVRRAPVMAGAGAAVLVGALVVAIALLPRGVPDTRAVPESAAPASRSESIESATPTRMPSRTPTPSRTGTSPRTATTTAPRPVFPTSGAIPPGPYVSVSTLPRPSSPSATATNAGRTTPTAARTTRSAARTAPTSCAVTISGVRVTVGAAELTRTVVNGTGGSGAVIEMKARTSNRTCTFTTVFVDRSGRIGYGGFAGGTSRRQGTGTTPTGTYRVSEAFGLRSNPGTALSYRRVSSDDWWILDFTKAPRAIWNSFYRYTGSGYQPKKTSDDNTESEHLASYAGQYDYAAVLDFNRGGDPAGMNNTRGGGIFLHVHGNGATAGCVSTTRANLVSFLQNVRSGDKITIVT